MPWPLLISQPTPLRHLISYGLVTGFAVSLSLVLVPSLTSWRSVNLESVVLSRRWSDDPPLRRRDYNHQVWITPNAGSPFARSWNIFHLKPYSLGHSLDEDKSLRGLSDGSSEFFHLSEALSVSGRRPSKLNVGTHQVFYIDKKGFGQGISPIVFDSSDRSMEMHDVLINTYAKIKSPHVTHGDKGTSILA